MSSRENAPVGIRPEGSELVPAVKSRYRMCKVLTHSLILTRSRHSSAHTHSSCTPQPTLMNMCQAGPLTTTTGRGRGAADHPRRHHGDRRVVDGALLVERDEARERRRDDDGAGAQHELRALHVDGGLDEGDEVVELLLGLLGRRDALRRDGERSAASRHATLRRSPALTLPAARAWRPVRARRTSPSDRSTTSSSSRRRRRRHRATRS